MLIVLHASGTKYRNPSLNLSAACGWLKALGDIIADSLSSPGMTGAASQAQYSWCYGPLPMGVLPWTPAMVRWMENIVGLKPLRLLCIHTFSVTWTVLVQREFVLIRSRAWQHVWGLVSPWPLGIHREICSCWNSWETSLLSLPPHEIVDAWECHSFPLKWLRTVILNQMHTY